LNPTELLLITLGTLYALSLAALAYVAYVLRRLEKKLSEEINKLK